MTLVLILLILILFYLFLMYLISEINPHTNEVQKIQSQPQFNMNLYRKFPTYTIPSILDLVPPPDPHHQYRCNNFSREPTGYTDFDRWQNEWSPDSIFI